MKFETELLDNRMARLKVEVEESALDKAKQEAARRIARQVNIPGFRKGKAPYRVVSQYFGEAAILEEAIEVLGPDVYRQVIDESQLDPYGPGQLEDVENEPTLTLVFSLPLRPTVDLGDYRAVREAYDAPEVTDEMVDEAMKNLQNRDAVLEPKDGPAAEGDQVKVLIYGVLLPQEQAADAEGETADGDDTDDEHEVLFDDEEQTFVLDEDNEPLPGFAEALIGIEKDGDRDFVLTFPEGEDTGFPEHYHGRQARFQVECQEVATRYLHPLNDDFAQKVTSGEIETLLELRMDLRRRMAEELQQGYEHEYGEKVLNAIIAQASFEYPEQMVEDYINDLLHNLGHQLEHQGLSLEDFRNLRNLSEEDLREQYRSVAVDRVKQSLAMDTFLVSERIRVEAEDISAAIEERSQSMSGGDEKLAEMLRGFMQENRNRLDVGYDLLSQRAYKRLAEIGRGEAPDLSEVDEDDDAAEPATEAAAPVEASSEAAEPASDESDVEAS